MKQRRNALHFIMVLVGTGCISAFAEPFAMGPYLGQTPPGPVAEVFAPGLICDTRPHKWEAFGTFSADGNTFCFTRGRDVFITENTNQGWTVPKRIEIIIDNHWSAWSPCLSPDANSIFFTIAERHPRIKHYDLFRCNRTSNGWTKPQRLGPPLSSPSNEITCAIAANNNIYMASGREPKDERSNIWVVPFVDNTWSRAVHITFNHPQACDPGIAPDESFMVVTAKDLPGGYGHRDLYLTLRLSDGTWSKPRNLGPRINTIYIEHGPRISPDKKYLFFNRSNGWGENYNRDTADIYWVELKEYLSDPNDPNINQTDSGFGITGSSTEPFARGPYLGQTPPGPVAEVFAPGLICDTRPHHHETHGHFSADGNTFCFRRFGYVYITENTDQGWTTPKRIRNIPYKSWSCCLSPDGNTIYFLDQFSIRSNRSANEPAKHIYRRCVRSSQGWSMPQQLGPPFTSAFGGFSVTADHSICFKSGKGYFEIAPFVGNTWAQPIEIPVEKGNLNPCHPGIAPDGSFLVFYSIAPGAQGGTPTDLYLMLRGADGSWTKPHRMGPGINTEYYEMGARISPDKKYMFFTRSNGWNVNSATDTADIYWVELKDHLPESYR